MKKSLKIFEIFRSLIEADLKKNETQHSLKKAHHELSKYKRDYLSTEAKYSQLKYEQWYLFF